MEDQVDGIRMRSGRSARENSVADFIKFGDFSIKRGEKEDEEESIRFK